MEDLSDTQSVEVAVGEWGVHSRPAASIVWAIRELEADVYFSHQSGLLIDGVLHSRDDSSWETFCVKARDGGSMGVLDLLGWAAERGTIVRISTRGPDATVALERLARLFESDFESMEWLLHE